VYVPTNELLLTALDQHADVLEGDAKPPMVVTGEPGSGKSALFANWAMKRFEHKHKEEFLFEHYVSASDRSCQLGPTLFRLEKALKDHFQLREMEVPDTEERLRWSLNRFLSAAAKKYSPARIVIIIDGVNKMKSESGATGSMHWLPTELPCCVRFLVSTTEFDAPDKYSPFDAPQVPNKTFLELQRRQCPVIRMDPLSVNTRQRIISLYLEKHATLLRLNEAEQFKIVTIPQTSQPQFLRFFLEMLRMENSLDHTKNSTDHCIDLYCQCDNDYEILEKTFTMHTNLGDHEFLKQVLSYVYVSRDGLAKEEIWSLIRQIMGAMPDTKNVKNFDMILENMTMMVEGRMCFSHELYKTAIYNRCIFSDANLIRLHLDMAKYFTQLPASPRKLVCLPHHLQIAGIWSKVKNCLTDISNFQLWWTEQFKADFMKFWASLTARNDIPPEEVKPGTERPTFDIVDEYTKSLEEFRTKTKPTPSDEKVADIVLDIADFLIEFSTLGHEEAADVPASIHPNIPSIDLKAIGVPHVTVEDGRSILYYPTVLGQSSGIGTEGVPKDKKNESNEPVRGGGASKAVEDIPMRTMYYFSRWMWIQFPLVALGNCRERFKKGVQLMENKNNLRRVTSQDDAKVEPSTDLDPMEELLRTCGFRRPKTTGGADNSTRTINPNKLKLPEIKFVRKAARSFRRMTAADEAEAGDSAGKIEQRMISLQDSIQNYREEYDFLYQQKLKMKKRLYELTGALVDINKAADSMGQYDDEFLETGNKAEKALSLNGNANVEHSLLRQLDIMCTRHPPHMPALIFEVESKIEQDIYLLAEIRKRLFEQHFEQQAHKVGFKEMKDLAAKGVEMYNKLLDFRLQTKQKMQENAAADLAASEAARIAEAQKGTRKKSKKVIMNNSMDMSLADAGGLLLENGSSIMKENENPNEVGSGGAQTWETTWEMISSRTGITEPEIFFQRVENRKTLEGQVDLLKKQAENRLESLKAEVVQVESELEEVSYDVSFTGAKSGDTSQKKKDIASLQAHLKRGKERTENYETLRKDALKGLKHIAEILGVGDDDEDLDKINLSDLTRHIEVVVDVLIEETARIEAAQDKAGSNQAMGDTKFSTMSKEELMPVPTALIGAMEKVESFRPRIPSKLPSRYAEVGRSVKEKLEPEVESLDRNAVKNASLRIIRSEKIKEARVAKEAADKLAAAMKD